MYEGDSRSKSREPNDFIQLLTQIILQHFSLVNILLILLFFRLNRLTRNSSKYSIKLVRDSIRELLGMLAEYRCLAFLKPLIKIRLQFRQRAPRLPLTPVPIVLWHHSLQQMPLFVTPLLEFNVNTTTRTHTIILFKFNHLYPL